MDEADYIRLHITPLTPNLLTVLFPPPVQAKLRNISYHTIQTFPEHSYGYLDLPRSEAERMKKKLQGCIVQGHKVRIETARSRRQPVIDSGTSYLPVSQSDDRKKRVRDELPGVDIGDRHVKRGWTTPAHELKKKITINSVPKIMVRSKYTNGPECLFKTTLPAYHAYHNQATGRIQHSKRRNNKEMVIHEFAKTTKYATFLRSHDSRIASNPVTEYVQGKGWLDEHGNVVEEVKRSKRPIEGVSDNCRNKQSRPLSVSGGIVDESRSNEIYNSSSDESCYKCSQVDSLERGMDEMEIDAKISMAEATDDVMEMNTSSSSSSSSSDGLDLPSSSSSSSTSSSSESSDSEAGLDTEKVLDENKQLRNRNSLSPTISSSSLSPSSTSFTSCKSLNDSEEEEEEEENDDINEDRNEDGNEDYNDDDDELVDEDEHKAEDEGLLYLENKSLSDESMGLETSAKSPLSIAVPSTCHNGLKVIHPLELLYKKEIISQNPDASTDCSQTEFTFFSVDGEVEDNDDPPSPVPMQTSVASPLTPFTRQDIERRTVRSPAPTPDTAHPYKHFDWSIGHLENIHEKNAGDPKDKLLDPGANSINHATSQLKQVSESSLDPSEFENWFWKNQGNINRSWKQRRKTVLKEHRQRDSRKKIF